MKHQKQQVLEALENAKANLDQAIAGLERIPETPAETVGYTAHKLKNYLTVVSATAELLEIYLASHPDEQVRTWIEVLQHSIQLTDYEVSRLVCSADGVEPKLRIGKVDLGLLVFRCCNFYQPKAANKQIRIHAAVQPGVHFVRTDRVAVAVVLDNLLSNALKFSARGTNVWVTVRAEQEQVVCAVRDEGPGFSPDDQARLFQRGVRLPNAPTGGERSTGFGLAIARDLVEKIGGKIECESRPGHGTTFLVRLPAFTENS